MLYIAMFGFLVIVLGVVSFFQQRAKKKQRAIEKLKDAILRNIESGSYSSVKGYLESYTKLSDDKLTVNLSIAQQFSLLVNGVVASVNVEELGPVSVYGYPAGFLSIYPCNLGFASKDDVVSIRSSLIEMAVEAFRMGNVKELKDYMSFLKIFGIDSLNVDYWDEVVAASYEYDGFNVEKLDEDDCSYINLSFA
jgi:hypothetical protein